MSLAPLPLALQGALMLGLGLVLGSFANVCIVRLPQGRSVIWPGSSCPACGASIQAWQNIPLLSFLLLRGRCAACGSRISARYPAVEAALGLLSLGLWAQFGFTPATLARLLFVAALAVLALIDAEHYLLPDAVTLPGIAAGVAVALFVPGWEIAWREALLTALGAYLAFAALARGYEKLRGIDEALGQGDWKMAAMLGAFLGWHALLLVVFLASLAGTLVGLAAVLRHRGDLRSRLPLGTYLALAGIASVFCGDALLAWYGALGRG